MATSYPATDEPVQKDLPTALREWAHDLIERRGLQALANFQNYSSACGCMGPQGTDPLCPCAMSAELAKHKVEILNEIAPDIALRILRRNLIRALKGEA